MKHENFDVEEVNWENVNENKFGKIKFIKKRNNIKRVIKVVTFVVIAAFSGAISSKFIMERKFSQVLKWENAKEQNNNGKQQNIEVLTTNIGKVAQKVGPSIVGIIKKTENYSKDNYDFKGSGVIVSSDGYIVTNNHIIKDAKEINVKLPNSPNYISATLIGKDDVSDIAVIKINAKSLPAAKFADSSEVNVGDTAIAIGNPLGEAFPGNVSVGIISGFKQSIAYGQSGYKVLQTDASINFTNSGGALCNAIGEVIGINSINLNVTKIEGMGFAINSNEVKNLIDEITHYGKVTKPIMGVNGRSVVNGGGNGIKGVYISEVIKDSSAESAGIKPTDIITELNGKPISKLQDIENILQNHKFGDNIKCKIWRNEKIVELNVILSVPKIND
ncbi:PDZ domain-containing protein [Clostridium botulinum C]|uniref:PDZ domain-containing protein n=3 Tax=Clostridium botulinum TaxID=1491 RepID=A0A9Q4XVE8_CLOBO|nr:MULTISPECIES: trypsin-like peptidase domain-containing protein [Clostridium]EGO88793.1 peptidase [Clostridium botulinum C str. Stockholm]EES91918.1 trypsin/PDZ domain protein [Clostridium botulinum D str. 1873]MBO3442275.1 trypsin-like peptidase domain-containing protein [Clostridium haemolyticum]MCD3195032.1 PDZ domain-containing protein [Clostridium botulinum C]MCD3200372.1 PDZ domain-containing protein [Clostridium botulinum C]